MESAALRRFTEVSQDPLGYLRNELTGHGKRVVGCFPMYVPEELIHAAGLHPAVMLADSRMTLDLAGRHIQSFFCGQARALVELGLRKDLDFLAGMVFGDVCEPVRLAGQIWRRERITDFTWSIRYPVTLNKRRSEEYLRLQFHKLGRDLEHLSGEALTPERMEASITLYNRTRRLLRDLQTHREANPELLPVVAFGQLCTAAMCMPKEEFNVLAGEHLRDLEAEQQPGGEQRPKIVVWGVCGPPPRELLEMIEEEGAQVAVDDLYVGNRYFMCDVREGSQDPLGALAAAHFEQPPCVTRNRGPETGMPGYLLDKVRRSHSRGVISILHKYCDAQGFEHPLLSERLRKEGIAELPLELDQGVFPAGQMRTRVQAFLEMIT